MFYIAIVVSIITSLFLRPIDKVFEILSAPLADSDKVKHVDTTLKKIERKISSAVRKASVRISSIIKKWREKRSEVLVAGSTTMIIPDSIKSAHEIAKASIALVAINADKKLESHLLNKQLLIANSKSISAPHIDEDSRSENSRNSNNSINEGKIPSVVTDDDMKTSIFFRSNKSITKLDTDNLFIKLNEDINYQRKLLKSSEVDQFDNQWSIDPTGEFVQGEKSLISCFKSRIGAEENIKKEIDYVKRVVEKKSEKLNLALDNHIGVEMLHLFILDLLGRETPAARIFESKAKEDFINTTVVTMRTRVLCYIFLVVINLFFAFYSILKGYQKGLDWQNSYLIACISQILVEIILFETMESIWIQFFVPNLISSEVQRVNQILSDTIVELCSVETKKEDNLVLDATEYLFVSTNLAKLYPDLMESVLILSYHTYLPGELSKKWQSGVSARIYRHNQAHQSMLLLTTIFILQSFATLPFIFHQMFIRFSQPFILFGYHIYISLYFREILYIINFIKGLYNIYFYIM